MIQQDRSDAWRSVDRLLAVRLDNVGDVVMLGPALRSVRRALPHTSITLLASPAGSQAAELLPWIDDVMIHRAIWQDASGGNAHEIGGDARLVDDLAAGRFDAALIFTSFSQSPLPAAYACHLAGIPLRAGESKDFGGALLTTAAVALDDAAHQVDRNLHLVAAVGLPVDGRDLELHVPGEAASEADRLLASVGIAPGEPFVAVAPGASCSARRYPAGRFADVVARLPHASGLPVVVLGAARDRVAIEPVIATGAPSLVGRTSVAQFAAVVRRASLAIANNSAALHLGDAFGRPEVIVYGGAELVTQWEPRASTARLLRREVACSPCHRFECPTAKECLDIPPAEVVRHALELLARHGTTATRQIAGHATERPRARVTEPHDLIDGFAGRRVLVAGDFLLDVYLGGRVDRVCREAPVPRVRLTGRRDAAGGAANVAVNVAALGGVAHAVGIVGGDADADRLRGCLSRAGVTCGGLVPDAARVTPALHRVFAGSQMLLRVDAGTTDALTAATEAALIERLRARWPECDAVIVSDYGYGTFTPAVVDAIAMLQRDVPRLLVVDAKHVATFRRLRATAVTPNWDEARELLNDQVLCESGGGRIDALRSCGPELLDRTGARMAVVTLDSDGAVVFEHGREPYRASAQPTAANVCTTGAGDTFLAALTLALAAGARAPAATDLACAAGRVVVGKEQTVACTAEELRRALAGHDKIVRPDDLAEIAAAHRRAGRRIVFTNGCFDLLHRGHTTHLNRAKLLGDVLIVAVNDDRSVRTLKGPHRPINPLDDRLRVLAELGCVDYVVAFGGPSPIAVLEAVRPDVVAKGGDYTRGTLPEAEFVEALGGEVVILPLEPDRSTSRIIERVRADPTTAAR